VRPSVPTVKDASRVRNPIDAFILAKLEEKGLRLAPEADRRTLARRAYFDLHGLPPTPEQVEQFVNDGEFNILERVAAIRFVFGGGVEFKLGHVRITPEFRYTRWGSENFRDPVAALLRTNKNQGDFILGLTF